MRILMVSPEYPPISGGVGRYTSNLVSAIKKSDCEVLVLCDEKGKGDYKGISPSNTNNSNIILKVVDDVKPDIVHIQFEPGLYGLKLALNPRNNKTYLDTFYYKCKIPIVTTFHSGYTFKEWMYLAMSIKKSGRTGKLGIPARIIVKAWNNLLYYRSFMELNREKLKQSHAGICFSYFMSKLLGNGSNIIYHGAEPAITNIPDKKEIRKEFCLPVDQKIAVVVGFQTVTKGWDLLNKLKMPEGWIMVTNSSKGDYNREKIDQNFNRNKDDVVDLKRGYLNDKELSLLLCASDAVLLPYKITSGSGVMFDALSHGLPFVSSNLEFFKEFANIGLGITSKRDPKSFSNAIYQLGNNYEKYNTSVKNFKLRLKWDNIANQHIQLYNSKKIKNNK